MTLIMTGKKTSSAAIIIFERGLRTPNQLLRMGAMAMIGTALLAIATGSSTSRAVAQRAVEKAMSTPPRVAQRQTAECLECCRLERAPQQLNVVRPAARIADGGGMTRRPPPAVDGSQPTMTTMSPRAGR